MIGSEKPIVFCSEIFGLIDIKKGDIIYWSSQLLRLMCFYKENGIKFDANQLIDALQRKIGEEGTILIPTFNWEFSNQGSCDIRTSPCTTGSLGMLAIEREDFERTSNSFDSFVVWGKYKDFLCSIDNKNVYGEDSPWGFMREKHAKCLIFGTDCRHAYTFVHYVENCEKIPFRYI